MFIYTRITTFVPNNFPSIHVGCESIAICIMVPTFTENRPRRGNRASPIPNVRCETCCKHLHKQMKVPRLQFGTLFASKRSAAIF